MGKQQRSTPSPRPETDLLGKPAVDHVTRSADFLGHVTRSADQPARPFPKSRSNGKLSIVEENTFSGTLNIEIQSEHGFKVQETP